MESLVPLVKDPGFISKPALETTGGLLLKTERGCILGAVCISGLDTERCRKAAVQAIHGIEAFKKAQLREF